jgi:cytoskeleton protein RodZ
MTRSQRPEIAGDAARLGAELRDARMALGLSVEDMAEALRIRRVYLSALEEGRIRDLPAPAYATGFVRSYARSLGLDENAAVRRFREVAGTAPRKPDLIFPEPVPERGMPTGALLLGGAVVAIGAYIGWYNWSGSGPRTVDAVPVPPPAIEQAIQQTPPTPAPPPVGVPPAGGTSASGTSASAASAPPAIVPPAVAIRPPPPPPAAAPAPAVDPNGPRIVLRATNGDTWLMVRPVGGGKAILNKTLKPGETFEVPREGQLVLSTGNIQNLEIQVDGAPYAGFEPGPVSRQNIALDPAKLKTDKVPAATPRQAPRPRA